MNLNQWIKRKERKHYNKYYRISGVVRMKKLGWHEPKYCLPWHAEKKGGRVEKLFGGGGGDFLHSLYYFPLCCMSFWVHFTLFCHVHLKSAYSRRGGQTINVFPLKSLKTHVSAIVPPTLLCTAHYTYENCNESRLEPPSGSKAKKPWWVSNWRSPQKLMDFRDVVGLQTYYPRNHFYYISIIFKNEVKFMKWLKMLKFLDWNISSSFQNIA
jgi:hypothetical protein